METISNEKIETGSQSNGRERGEKERRMIMRSVRAGVIDWILQQVAILGFIQPSKQTHRNVNNTQINSVNLRCYLHS